jgi:hypothetical protein
MRHQVDGRELTDHLSGAICGTIVDYYNFGFRNRLLQFAQSVSYAQFLVESRYYDAQPGGAKRFTQTVLRTNQMTVCRLAIHDASSLLDGAGGPQ